MQTLKYRYPKVLTIAGSDSGGAAGIQADLKTISAIGCYGMSVITALTAQNSTGVQGVLGIDPHFVEAQLKSIFSDLQPDAIKIGMVHSPELARTIAFFLKGYPDIPVVFDPVMVATSGDRLIEENTVEVIIRELFPLSTLITPNMDEAALLAQIPVNNINDMLQAGKKIISLGCRHVIVKGGPLKQSQLTSILIDKEFSVKEYHQNKIDTQNINGAGCTFSSAIASYLALGNDLLQAVESAQLFISKAIDTGKDTRTGTGNGPLNHFFQPSALKKVII